MLFRSLTPDGLTLAEMTLSFSPDWVCCIHTDLHAKHDSETDKETVYLIDFTPRQPGASEFTLRMTIKK